MSHLSTLGCSSHSLALCSSHTSKLLPESVQDLVNYIGFSPKPVKEYEQFQEFTNIAK